ncbi:MAG: hypothetical protein Q9184_004526 [Pyrenodesmia sp. 2 TL-2023]
MPLAGDALTQSVCSQFANAPKDLEKQWKLAINDMIQTNFVQYRRVVDENAGEIIRGATFSEVYPMRDDSIAVIKAYMVRKHSKHRPDRAGKRVKTGPMAGIQRRATQKIHHAAQPDRAGPHDLLQECCDIHDS